MSIIGNLITLGVADGGSASLDTLTVEANGTYTPSAGTDGWDEVVVNVPVGSVEENDVIFIDDYDGQIKYSYNATEFAALTELPANPSHTGMIAQGWNWTLADAKAYVAKTGGIVIGQSYIPSDGKTRLYIELDQTQRSLYLGLYINGTVEVDWGDSSAKNTVTGSNINSLVQTAHTYAQSGSYTIAIESKSGTFTFSGHVSYGSYLLKKSTPVDTYHFFSTALKAVEIGNGVTSLANYAFYDHYALERVTIPTSVQSLGQWVFINTPLLRQVTLPAESTCTQGYTCNGSGVMYVSTPKTMSLLLDFSFGSAYSLVKVNLAAGATAAGSRCFASVFKIRKIVLPDGVTTIGTFAFQSCSALQSILIPSGCTSIGASAFIYCRSLRTLTIPSSVTSIAATAFSGCVSLSEIHFKSTTPPTIANANAFDSLPASCIIYVPTGALSSYTGATNYPSSSTYTYVEE